jgi:hypothetical protein
VEYARPEVTRLSSAIEATQSTMSKPVGLPDSASPHMPSPAAYEADE